MIKDQDSIGIKAVEDSKLKILLKNIGVFDDIVNKNKNCKFCHCILIFDDISAIFHESRDVKFVCSNPNCLKEFMRYRNLKKYGE